MKPLVSILCITYNHEKYIGEALDGFLMQKTDFPFEILIHDDASTDNTGKIIRKYAEKHPKIFKPIFEKENQYSKGNFTFIEAMYKSALGKYIAWCEGDDYWSDPQKLQLQVDFLEKNPDYAICFHPVRVFFEKEEEKEEIYPDKKKYAKFTVEELLRENFIQTNSVVYRRVAYKKIPEKIMPQDWYIHLYHAQFGKINFIDKVMAVYRRHEGGAWWDSYNNRKLFWEKQGIPQTRLYIELLKLYGKNPDYRKIIYQSISNLFSSLIEADPDGKNKLLHNSIDVLPNIEEFISNRIIENQNSQESIRILRETISHLEHVVRENEQRTKTEADRAERYLSELNGIYNSKTWRYVNKAAKIKRKAIKPKKQ